MKIHGKLPTGLDGKVQLILGEVVVDVGSVREFEDELAFVSGVDTFETWLMPETQRTDRFAARHPGDEVSMVFCGLAVPAGLVNNEGLWAPDSSVLDELGRLERELHGATYAMERSALGSNHSLPPEYFAPKVQHVAILSALNQFRRALSPTAA